MSMPGRPRRAHGRPRHAGRPAGAAPGAQRGFTLIEVLVALVLLALLGLIAWRGLDAVQRVSGRLDARAEETLSLVRAWRQLERDLRRHAGEDVLPAWRAAEGGPDRAGLAFPAPGVAWARASGLLLVRSTDDGRWQRLHWYVNQGVLYRAAGAPSDRLPLPGPTDAVAVLDGLRAWSLREWRHGQGWTDPQAPPADASGAGRGAARPGTDAAQAMAAVGLEIVLLRQEAGEQRAYRKVVVLP
ncbi:PulJ/GspJ family protein [Castellaniella defragrans]|uniref:General secretion pathway protein J n=1 Tax=Castellaniella defragrans TaxID=75697 RepID=A0A7W9TN32_CASDE|nr:prepilin-type N-terminal cleavage/methylation domain-containing protein [Castellaniella defragrans]MBB6083564.1 general secretion pathway protein J [Castellaniella defragrans]